MSAKTRTPFEEEEQEPEMGEVVQFWTDEAAVGVRLDHFLVPHFPDRTRSQIQDWIEEGQVMVQGRQAKSSLRLKAGQEILVEIPPLEPADPEAEEGIPLEILFEDSHLLVLNKQKGLVIHPAFANRSGTLVNALLHHCDDLSGIRGVEMPGIVHRLDKDTTGVMVVAKSDAAHVGLSTQFRDRAVTKIYEAIVHGHPHPARGRVNQPIARHANDRIRMTVSNKGKTALTDYEVKEHFEYQGQRYARVELHLHTGRTHQIRVHLSWLGYPIVGDPLYGKRPNPWGLSGQALHCRRLGFVHPVTHIDMEHTSLPPAHYQEILDALRGEVQSHGRTSGREGRADSATH